MSRQYDQAYAVGQHVGGRVEKVLPYGIFVRLDDGTRAYIRRRELSWASDVKPQEVVQEGRTIEAIVLKPLSPGRNMELSFKATLPDPWQEFIAKFREGDVVGGTAKDIRSYGVFVEILPGVNGLVPLEELNSWEVEKPEDVVWEGDDVEAVITRIDRRARKVGLSIRLRMQQLARAAEMMELLDRHWGGDTSAEEEPAFSQKELESATGDWEPADEPKAQLAEIERVGRILVIDDHDEVRGPLVEWLHHRGYEADGARTPVEAREMIRQQSYGVLLVDINLPGMDGLALMRQIKAQMADARIAVMSIIEWLEERAREIEELGVIEVFVKPLDLEEIERLLGRIGGGEPLPSWRASPTAPPTSGLEPLREFTTAVETGASLADRLQVGLERLVETTRAEVGMVFHMDAVSQAVSILAQAGTAKLAKDAIYSLKESPVKDVIRSGESIFERHASGQAEGRFRKLLDLLPFESCIGVPVETEGGIHHALFLFHRRPGAFRSYHLRDAMAAAILFAAAIEREALGQRVQSLNRLLLSGQLAAGFGHEVYNKMPGREIQLRNLHVDCGGLERRTPGLAGSSDYREVKRALDGFTTTARDLKSTVELFQRLMRAEDEGKVDVNAALHSAEALLRPVARRNKVKIKIESAPDLPHAMGSGIHLQQVFLNVMLNAIQHMAVKSQDGRMLEVGISHQAQDGERPIKVRFSDNGPGIHKQLWDKVFTLGFSTRPGGTGLGLFIARSLIESLGGTIRVERSVVPLGTTFLVELPQTAARGEAK